MSLLNTWITRCENACLMLERRLGRIPAAGLLGVLLVVAGGLYASENFVPFGFGTLYAALSVNPFNFDTPDILQFRLFAPVIGHWLHLRGNLFPLLTHGASVLLLATLYTASRRRGQAPALAAGLTAMVAFSITVLGEIHFPGTTDPVSYLFLLWAMLTLRHPLRWPVFFALALMNHEATLFALPGLLVLGWSVDTRHTQRLQRLLLAAGACVPAGLMKLWLDLKIQSDIPLGAADYLTLANITSNVRLLIPLGALGVFIAFKLFWCLPALGAVHDWQAGRRCRALAIVLLCLGPLAQLLIAKDTTRLMGLAFPAILLGAQSLHGRWGEERFTRRLWALLLLSLLIPTATVWGNHVIIFHPLPITMLVQILFGIPL